MKKLFKELVLLFGAALCVSGCSSKVMFVYNDEVTITEGDRISYYNFYRLNSHTDLIDQDGFKHVYKTYEEAMTYKDLLKEKSIEVYDDYKSLIGYSYEATISFLESLNPDTFQNKNLFISGSWSEMSYNVNSCRLEGVYLKDDVLYIHEYCDYIKKSASHSIYNLCYTFFLSKKVDFTDVKWKTTNLFKY